MKCTMKKNMTALAMSAALAAGTLGYMSAAQAEPVSANFSNNIHVISTNSCDLDVTLPTGSRDFVANWTHPAASGAATTMVVDAATVAAPPEILVAITGGAGCKLDNLKLSTAIDDVSPVPGGTRTFLKAVTGSTNGGYWRFTPTVAKATLYADAAATSGATTSVEFIDPTGKTLSQSASAKGTRSGEVPQMETAGVKGILMTDNYFSDGVEASLVAAGSGESQLKALDPNGSYKAMKIGISAILGTDPESAAGTPAVLSVASGDSVDIKYTVTITTA